RSLTADVAPTVVCEGVKPLAASADYGNQWLKTHSAGSGPYQLRSWRPNESVTPDRFEGYWRGAAGARRILLRHLPEPSTQQLLLQKGDIDIARNLNPSQVAALGSNAAP